MTNKQPLALWLADLLDGDKPDHCHKAAELRRLHSENERLMFINDGLETKIIIRAYELLIDSLERRNEELQAALQPFVVANSSEEFVTLVVRSSDVAKARAVLVLQGNYD